MGLRILGASGFGGFTGLGFWVYGLEVEGFVPSSGFKVEWFRLLFRGFRV